MSDYINPDYMALFLKKLAVKTLLQCRSVCKRWKQLIDSNPFIADHLAVQKPLLIAQNVPFKYLIIDLHNLPSYHTLKGPIQPNDDSLWPYLICCVHGVICLHYHNALHLWNPSIHRLSTIPLPQFVNHPISEYQNKWISFWIDPFNNHFKIVVVHFKGVKVNLFSSTKRAWTETEVDTEIQELGGDTAPRQVLLNGVAYWMAYRRSPGYGVVVYFDFTEDEFGTIDVPKEAEYNSNVFKWQDSLSLLFWVNGMLNECHLWAMRNGSWAKMFIFEIDDNLRLSDILCVEASLGRVLAQTKNDHLVLYDPVIWRKRIAPRSKFISLCGNSRFLMILWKA